MRARGLRSDLGIAPYERKEERDGLRPLRRGGLPGKPVEGAGGFQAGISGVTERLVQGDGHGV